MDNCPSVMTPPMGTSRACFTSRSSEAKRVLGQGQAPFRFRPVRFPHLRTRRIEAAPNLEGEPHDSLQGRDGAVVVVGGPHGSTAAWAMTHNRLQGLREGWGRSGCST